MMERCEPLTHIFDCIHHFWEHPRTQKILAVLIFLTYLLALAGIEANREGLLPENTLFQLCMGIPYGAEATTKNLLAMIDALPAGAHWGAFGIGREEYPMVAQAVLNGGNIRVGLEDNIYLAKGVFATNEELVTKAVELVERLGAKVLTAAQARERLGL